MTKNIFQSPLYLLKSSIIPAIILFSLYLISLHNYLLFHGIVEITGIAVALCIFTIVWNTRNIITNTFILIIGISSVFIGSIDLIHTLAYKGMGFFPGMGADLPTQLWIAARFFQSAAFLVAALYIGKKLTRNHRHDTGLILAGCTVVWVLLIASIFYWHNFPACFVEGVGLTHFKIASEYSISILFILTIILLYQSRRSFDPEVWILLVIGQVFLISGELAFTSYVSVYGFMNMLGHLFRLISIYLFYLAIVVVSLTRPFDLLFLELKRNEDALLESETRYRSLFEHMIEGNALHELIFNDQHQAVDYRILAVNPGYERILHISQDEVVGKISTDAYQVAEPPYLDRYAQVEQTGKPDTFDTFFPKLKKNFSISVYSPKKGQFATLFSDITERIKAEEILVKSNKKLNLLSSITRHDIGNEIQVLYGYLGMALCIEREERIKGYLEKAELAVQNIDRQISFTRDYQDIGVQSPVWQDIGLIILHSSKRLQISSIRIVIEISGVEVYADPLMEKVFNNLIDNAKRYGEKITMIRFSGSETEGRFRIICEDDGIGIPPEFKAKIFNREYYKHTGFGLYLSREILDITGLSIREEGTLGEGARFVIEIPEGAYRFIS